MVADEILGLAQFDAPPEPLSLEHFPAEQSLLVFMLLGRNSKIPWQASPTPPVLLKKKKKKTTQKNHNQLKTTHVLIGIFAWWQVKFTPSSVNKAIFICF